jgi:hypothetical protein
MTSHLTRKKWAWSLGERGQGGNGGRTPAPSFYLAFSVLLIIPCIESLPRPPSLASDLLILLWGDRTTAVTGCAWQTVRTHTACHTNTPQLTRHALIQCNFHARPQSNSGEGSTMVSVDSVRHPHSIHPTPLLPSPFQEHCCVCVLWEIEATSRTD